DLRSAYKDQLVKVRGQFSPSQSDRIFGLMRMKIQCCGADALPVKVEIISREPVTTFKQGAWIEVTGKVDFRRYGTGYLTMLRVNGPGSVKPIAPDLDPYLQ